MSIPATAPKTVTSWIGGAWVSRSGQELEIVHPATEEAFSTLHEADASEVDAAVRAARAADASGVWSGASVAARKAVLLRVRDLILAHSDELARLEIACTGTPLSGALNRHVPRAAMNFEFFAEYISQASNSVFDQNPDFLTYVTRTPIGVAALIAPWNAPLALASMKLAGALAFGNSCVLKPSEMTPVVFVRLMELLREAGVPDGVVNLVNGRGAVTGAALASHPDIRAVAFTGGTATGRLISAAAGQGLKKVVTELGGKSANIIFDDADYARALDAALVAIFSNNGQQCLAGSRILVQRRIADRFIADFTARAKQLRLGDPYDPKTELGPLISATQRARVLGFAQTAREDGDEILTGGHAAEAFSRGFYVAPTVALAKNNSTRVCREEIFGPFATILVFDDEEEALAIANNSDFGLVAYVWSQNLARVMRCTRALQTGIVWVNTPLTRELRAPFGGFKMSGVGRDGGDWSRAFFTEERTVTIAVRDFPLPAMGTGPRGGE